VVQDIRRRRVVDKDQKKTERRPRDVSLRLLRKRSREERWAADRRKVRSKDDLRKVLEGTPGPG